ncbi:hypothetical protein ACJX0J_029373, partial [Zea mays]
MFSREKQGIPRNKPCGKENKFRARISVIARYKLREGIDYKETFLKLSTKKI